MKIYTPVLFVFVTFVYVSAIEFKLTKNGNTCVLFTTANNSQIKIRSNVNNTEEKTFNFDAATVDQTSSECFTPQLWLNFPSNIVAKYLFSKIANNATSVNILVQFKPNQVFPGDSNAGIQIADDQSNQMIPPHLQSYQCNTEESIQFSRPDNYTVEMVVSGVRLQAFDVQNGQFSKASICAADAQTTQTTQPTTQPETTEPTTQPETTENPTTSRSYGTSVTPEIPTSPTPPAPPVNTFALKNGDDTCIIFKAGISFEITYNTTDQKTAVANIYLPNATLVDQVGSSCYYTANTQRIVSDFLNNWKLSVVFELEQSLSYYLQTVTLTYVIDVNIFPNAASRGKNITITTELPAGRLETTTYSNYRCDKVTTFILNTTTDSLPVSMTTQYLQYLAFNTGSFWGFDADTTECPADDPQSNIIAPVAIGAGLMSITMSIAIILFAYQISRKRNRGGYEHV